jgi:pimeloyl-ACP methyl ester carboxylesterase
MTTITHHFPTPDGTQLAYRELGAPDARPVLLIHGLFSDGLVNWVNYGTAAKLVAAGFRCIIPDLRAHGASAKPHDAAAYPPEVLVQDQVALLAHLGITDYDLVGYSLGARTAAAMLVQGAKPRKAILAGMGLSGLTDTAPRRDHFHHVLRNLGTHERGSPAFMAEAFLKTTGGDPVALDLVLDTFRDVPEAALRTIETPVAVLCGADDNDNGSADALANLLPHGTRLTVPGNHMSCVTLPAFGMAICDYLTS